MTRLALSWALMCLIALSNGVEAQVQLTPAQQQMLNALPPAQRQ